MRLTEIQVNEILVHTSCWECMVFAEQVREYFICSFSITRALQETEIDCIIHAFVVKILKTDYIIKNMTEYFLHKINPQIARAIVCILLINCYTCNF